MSLTNLTLSDLKQLERLLSRKAALASEIDAIDRKLESFQTGTSVARLGVGAGPGRGTRKGAGQRGRPKSAATGAKKAAKGRRGRRGKTKERVIAVLQESGKSGIHVRDLARKIKANENSLRVWFYTTGKTIPEIKHMGRAMYGWSG